MRRLRLTHRTWSLSRLITLRPESTKDPIRYPLGYIPLDGSESIDAVYSLVKQGHFVAPLRTIESLHKAHIGIRTLCIAEHPIASIQDVVSRSLRQRELQSKVLIPRDFWTLEDFNDPELNQSYGIQNYLFDNYKWSQVLWKRFQLFVEQYFPIGEHSHLLYDEYMQLIRSFHAFEEGIGVAPLLPRTVRLHPSFGVTVPGQCSLEPLILLKRWLSNFRATLGISKALVLNAGCGAAAFAVKLSNVPMVRAVASSPRHIEACRKDTKLYPKLSNISFQVAEMFPRGDDKGRDHKYDMIVFYPDENMVSMLSSFQEDHFFAPGESGYYGSLEAFFENASAHLSDSGVVAICCTNLNSFIRPNAPHPIEYEVKVNRRFVILDYYDTPLKWKGRLGSTSSSQVAVNSLLQKNLRSELWILHKVESISHFGFFHGIPGAKPPPTAYSWKAKRSRVRQQELRDHVELMGGDWQDYKARLIHMLQQQSDVEEDDVAQSIRMSLDPSYPLELAKKAKVAVERRIRDDEEFHCDVSKQYTEQSPRERFDALHSQQ